MSVTTSYPGVYIEEDASPSLSVSSAPTAVPVFIGPFTLASGAAVTPSQCIRVANWLEFTSQFSSNPTVAVAIVSTAPPSDPEPSPIQREGATPVQADSYTYTATASVKAVNPAFDVKHYFQNGGGACYVLPLLDPSSATELAAMSAAIESVVDITLLCLATGAPTTVYSDLNTLLASNKGYFLIASSSDGATTPGTQADQTAVYYPDLNTSYCSPRPLDTAIAVTGYTDAAGKTASTMAQLQTVSTGAYSVASAAVDTALAVPLRLSSVAAMAGIYCSTDASRGVWKAPANVTVSGITGVSALVTDDQQGTMNNAGINVIRNFASRGVVVWGARTLAGTSDGDTSWRYIPVRRLFNSAERDIKKSMQTMVFEPNNAPTWEKVRSAIENYLNSLWKQGALAGATPKDAYFVNIGLNVTMTQDQIDAGQMIATVGMAAVRPAEFIILQFTQNMSS
ncbi:phage tail sheath subtilisin-like domain-containing protein [Paraburkholderia xenovorans]|uniref:phage tail sheath family protein n=1 Tax=Paraburkholderia xenovorans TaxID=36873 RepID=UPI0038B710EC